jgi:hypothetical protein
VISGQPVSEVLDWDDRTVATVWEYLDERADAERDALRAARRGR